MDCLSLHLPCVCALLHSSASRTASSVIPSTHVVGSAEGISSRAPRVTGSNQNARVDYTDRHQQLACQKCARH
jgi:hypothetical protein